MSFPAEVADKLFDYAAEHGVDVPALRVAAGIAEGAPVSHSRLCALYEAGARLTGDDAFGLHVGERTRPEMYGLLGYATAHAITFGDALERLVSLQAVWTDAVAFELILGAKAVTLRYREQEGIPPRDRRQETEQMMAAVRAFADAAAGEVVPLLELRFEHEAPADTKVHARVFACPLRFGAPSTEMILSRAAFERPMVRADPALGALLQDQAETLLATRGRRDPLLDRVRSRLRKALAAGAMPPLKQVAEEMGVGPRTLQRRLSGRNASWRSMCEEVRVGLAREMLADPRLALAQIAFRAGFSQTSAFHRAFRRIEGETPGRYRNRVLACRDGQ